MAIHTTRTDDLNGDHDAEPVIIVVNGEGVEIDLAPKSAAELSKLLAKYYDAGTVGKYDVERRGRMRRAEPKSVDPKAVRAWAAANGVQVSEFGRVPQHIVDQYLRS